MKKLPRFLRERFRGYEILDFKEWLSDGKVEIILCAKDSKVKCCHRCKGALGASTAKHLLILEDRPAMSFRTFVRVWRHKGWCESCKKYRSEKIDFICPESPHLTAEYGWWLGRLCEISSITNAANLMKHNGYTLWRHDFHRMQRMLQHYRIPPLTRISVDEVYARRKNKYEFENRNNKFFTVISDLNTHKVVYVIEGRSKEALDSFYKLLGSEACSKIEVVATDQFDGYAASTREHCPNATLVWDKFHILQNFEEAINEVRKNMHEEMYKNNELKSLTRGNWKYVFLKRASKRTDVEKEHIESIIKINEPFFHLELIKESMLNFFYEPNVEKAKEVFESIGHWIMRMGKNFAPLLRWYNEMEKNWSTLVNYFKYPVTTSLSEGINNVIKMLKRRAFGYRNMDYFRLKIMQKCGYLNSNFIDLHSLP